MSHMVLGPMELFKDPKQPGKKLASGQLIYPVVKSHLCTVVCLSNYLRLLSSLLQHQARHYHSLQIDSIHHDYKYHDYLYCQAAFLLKPEIEYFLSFCFVGARDCCAILRLNLKLGRTKLSFE